MADTASEQIGAAHVAVGAKLDPSITAKVEELRKQLRSVDADGSRAFRSVAESSRVYLNVLTQLSAMRLPFAAESAVLKTLSADFSEATRMGREFAAVQRTIQSQSRGSDVRGGFNFMTGKYAEPDIGSPSFRPSAGDKGQRFSPFGFESVSPILREGQAEKDAAAQKAKAAAQQQMNLLEGRSVQLKHQLATAEQQHTLRVDEYRKMLQASLITQREFDLAQANSARAMRTQTSSFGKGAGQFAFQASYAVQDIATVASMQGMRAADIARAAANNVSQMFLLTTAINPVLGGVLAAASTLALVFGPQLFEALTGVSKGSDLAAEGLKRLADILDERTTDMNRERSHRALFANTGVGSGAERRMAAIDLRFQMEARANDIIAAEAEMNKAKADAQHKERQAQSAPWFGFMTHSRQQEAIRRSIQSRSLMSRILDPNAPVMSPREAMDKMEGNIGKAPGEVKEFREAGDKLARLQREQARDQRRVDELGNRPGGPDVQARFHDFAGFGRDMQLALLQSPQDKMDRLITIAEKQLIELQEARKDPGKAGMPGAAAGF